MSIFEFTGSVLKRYSLQQGWKSAFWYLFGLNPNPYSDAVEQIREQKADAALKGDAHLVFRDVESVFSQECDNVPLLKVEVKGTDQRQARK